MSVPNLVRIIPEQNVSILGYEPIKYDLDLEIDIS